VAIVIKSKSKAVDLYPFGVHGTKSKGSSSMKEVLGGKGANLCEMSNIGIRVPEGVVIPTQYCVSYLSNGAISNKIMLSTIMEGVLVEVSAIEDAVGYQPLFSVRSGARVSMPGMMDTILNVGLTTSNLDEWVDRIGLVPALDSYRRLIQMFGSVVGGIKLEAFEDILKETGAADQPTEETLIETIHSYKELYLDCTATDFPDTLEEQLEKSIIAVFESWDNDRAKSYRKIHDIPEDWGTAVTIQRMVFGNMGDDCATGVVFSRDPSTGENIPTGEYLVNAQGEDVVAGIRTPLPLIDMKGWHSDVLDQLCMTLSTLEHHYKDMQDVEFTVEKGVLYILQTRAGKRSAKASIVITHDLLSGGFITEEQARERLSLDLLSKSMTSTVKSTFTTPPDVVGIPAGGGVVKGRVATSAQIALGVPAPTKIILVTQETNPDDIAGMHVSVGILTATGGLTSHAAVVARGMNKACVVGATQLEVKNNKVYCNGEPIAQDGDECCIDGATGNVWFGKDVPVDAGGVIAEAFSLINLLSNGRPMLVDVDVKAPNYGLVDVSGTVILRSASLESDDVPDELIGDILEKAKEMYGSGLIVELEPLGYLDSTFGVVQSMVSSSYVFNYVLRVAGVMRARCIDAQVILPNVGSASKGDAEALSNGLNVIHAVKDMQSLSECAGKTVVVSSGWSAYGEEEAVKVIIGAMSGNVLTVDKYWYDGIA